MAERRLRMDARLLRGALWQQRGTASLAVLAVAIGASVASALLHVSFDVSRKLTRELRALGPNLIVVPEDGAAGGFLDAARAERRVAAAGLAGAPLLYVAARAGDAAVPVIGADLARVRALHPAWTLDGDGAPTWMGVRLMRRLGVTPGQRLTVTADGGASRTLVVGPALEAGGPDDEAWWIPLGEAQALAGRPGAASVVQARVEGDGAAARAAEASIERGGGLDAVPLHALTAAESRLLERTRRLMTLVTVAALLAAGLCAFGSLTDLALERRREIALMKALGAAPADVVRQFAFEAVAIGVVGGIGGWLLGLAMAELIGREVFHASIAVRADVPVIVLGLALLVSGIASVGPVRLALGVEAATALKEN